MMGYEEVVYVTVSLGLSVAGKECIPNTNGNEGSTKASVKIILVYLENERS